MSSTDFYYQLGTFETAIYRFAISLTKSSVDSEDLVQETIYKALKNLEKFKVGTNFKAWLMTIMRNIFINEYRKKRKWNLVDINALSTVYQMNKKKHDINHGETYFLKNDIQEAFGKINTTYKTPLKLYADGYSYIDIAEQLEIPVGTVKSRIFKARKLLQKELKKYNITQSYNNI